MRLTQAMAQIGWLVGGWEGRGGVVFVNSPNDPGEETVCLEVGDLIYWRFRPEGSGSNRGGGTQRVTCDGPCFPETRGSPGVAESSHLFWGQY